MKKNFLRMIMALVIAASLVASHGDGVSAEASQAPLVTVSPAITEWAVAPGETATKRLRIINSSDEPMIIKVESQGLVIKEDISEEDSRKIDASTWLTASEPHFILKARETKQVTIKLVTPKKAEPGGHYATIYFQRLVPVTSNGQTTIAGQVGALAFVTVKGKIVRHLEASGPIHSAEQPDGSVAISLGLRNSGNVHILPTGKFIVKDWRGQIIKNLPITSGVVLPRTTRAYVANWREAPAVGHFAVRAEVAYADQKLLITQDFWVIPEGWIITAVVGAVCVWLFVFRIRKRWILAIKLLLKE